MANTNFGTLFSAALDPHHRAAMRDAIESIFSQSFDTPPNVVLIGWQAATFLSLVSSRAGQVTIIEDEPALIESIRHNLEASGAGEHVRLIEEPVTSVTLPTRADLVITTLTPTWFIDGDGAHTLNYVRENFLAEQGTIIPRRAVHLFELVSAPTEVGGFSMRVPRFSRPGEPLAVLSESKHFLTHDLTSELLPEDIDDTIYVKAALPGTVTGIRLRTLYELADNVTSLTSAGGVQSIIVPLREDVDADADQPINLHLRYGLGQGLDSILFSGRAVPFGREDALSSVTNEVIAAFQKRVSAFIEGVDARGRASDLDKVVSYTIHPHGDVSRLTALFWTVDEEFRGPLREIIETFRHEAGAQGNTPDDDAIYNLMYEVYEKKRA